MAGLKKNRLKDYFDMTKDYEELGIGNVKSEEVYAMVPVEFSYERGSDGVTVGRYAAVRDGKELEKMLDAFRSRIRQAEGVGREFGKEIDALAGRIRKTALNAGIVIRGAQLDTMDSRPFFYRKDKLKTLLSGRYDFFQSDKAKGKARLYLDDMKDLERIDWQDVYRDVSRKEKEYTIGLEKIERAAEKARLEEEKAEEKVKAPKRIPATDRVKAEASKEKTREVVVLRYGSSPANTVMGDAMAVSAKEESLKDKGAPSQHLKKEIKTVRDNRVTKVPVVPPPVQPYNARVDEGGRGR